MNKKGSFAVGIWVLLGLVILTIVFLIGAQVVAPIFEVARNDSMVAASPKATATIDTIEKIWYVFPIIAFILLLVWAFMRATKEEPYNY